MSLKDEDFPWTFLVRRGSDGEVAIKLGDVSHIMTERQAETLANMIRDVCQCASDRLTYPS